VIQFITGTLDFPVLYRYPDFIINLEVHLPAVSVDVSTFLFLNLSHESFAFFIVLYIRVAIALVFFWPRRSGIVAA
jgi:hypothetical protein